MNHLRLLTTGKSLVGLKESESHYRVSRERLLPHFGSARNPFTTTEEPAAARSQPLERTERSLALPQEPEKIKREPARTPAGASGAAAPTPSAGLTGTHAPTPKRGIRSWTVGFQTNWTGKVRALFSRPVAKPARVAYPSTKELPVQGELSLDRIKVVRNDLSDADLEIVPFKSSTPRPGATPVLQAMENPLRSGAAWSRFSGLFGVSKR
jgi:hypothetical protein